MPRPAPAEALLAARSWTEGLAYRRVAKPLFFRQDPERIHDRMTAAGRFLGAHSLTRWGTRALFDYADTSLEQEVLGISFSNPIGLSAGFDKDAKLVDILPEVGFGFMEVGSVTARPYAGNAAPRLARVPELKSLVVNYGLKSEGCEAVAERLAGYRRRFPVGVSLAPTNDEGTAEIPAAIADYLVSYRRLAPLADYITLNLSCPNTTADQPFFDPGHLKELLAEVGREPERRPLFLKLSPDVTAAELDKVLQVAERHRVDGVVCTNLLKKRPTEIQERVAATGGLSGAVVRQAADEMVAHVRREYGERFVIIGSGGVFSAEDAYRKIGLGASLVQLITGMIYEGPQLIGAINQGLVRLLRRDGLTSITQAVGKDL